MKVDVLLKRNSLYISEVETNTSEKVDVFIGHIMKGDKGDRGEKGGIGYQGVPGEKGDRGQDGRNGRDGVPGPPGRDGRPGRDGKDGISVNTLRPLFVSRGAVWNETTGFYELNGLTDITEEQMIQIYNQTSATLIGMDWNEKCLSASCRTNFESNSVGRYVGGLVSMGTFAVTDMESIIISSQDISPFTSTNITHMFRNSIKLRNIIGIMLTNQQRYNNGAFIGCKSLEDVTIKGLTISIYIGDSPLLTRDSILYLINNAENTAPITVALHATALSRLTQADIALASSKNITLAA
ncbi:MAG: hypothetical protein RSB85_05780 [Rikenellaceae bacterium]